MTNTNKIYGGLIAFAVKPEDMPTVGETVHLEQLSNPSDANAYGISKGKGIYLVQKQELIDQCPNYKIATATEFNNMFKTAGCEAKVVDVVDVLLANGRNANMIIVEADTVSKNTQPQQQTNQVSDDTKKIVFTGNKIKYPAKEAFWNVVTANPNQDFGLKIIKNGNLLLVKYNNEAIGENSVQEDINLFKNFEGVEVDAKFVKIDKGLITLEVDLKDLKLDMDSLFNNEIKRVVDEGIETEDTVKKYIDLMIYYGIEPELVKAILNGWKKYDEEGESLIPSIDAAVRVINGKTYYSYIDNCESIHDLAAWTLCGTPLRLIGEMSTGKNLALKTLATIFRRPFYRLSCDGNIDDSTLLGNTTLKDGVVEFEEGLPIKAAKKGYWVILDEVNAAPADALIALHSLLEGEDGTITIKEIGKIIPNEDYRIFATMNANNDDNLYAGTKSLNGAFESRWTTISLKNQINIKEVLKNKCVGAKDTDINKVALVYNSLATIVADPTTDFPSSFIAMRAYVDILNGPSQISLKGRCIQKLANINTNDASYEEIVVRTIDDIFGK